MVPRGFAARGFGGDVPFDYPYRDDALALWEAIRDWVASYLAIFYPDDGAVQSDGALQGWSAFVRAQDGGRVATFPELQSIDTLVDALAAIIYAASALHAAGKLRADQHHRVHAARSGRRIHPGGTGARSLRRGAVARHAPAARHGCAAAPSSTYTLGAVHHTQLGRYELPWFLPSGRNIEIQERLGSFHHQLGTIEAGINARNARLPVAFQYPYLLPSQVPQSINI